MKTTIVRYRIWRKLSGPIRMAIKICNIIHTLTGGNSHSVLGFSIIFGISDMIVSIFGPDGLFLQWMKKRQNTPEAVVLKKFSELRKKSLCPFARKAKLYAGSIGRNQDIATAVGLIMPRMVKFTEIGKERKLDGFVIELPADLFARNLVQFSKSFNCLLRELARQDPSGENCFRGGILKKGWQFTFNHTRLFVTTFAPFYSPDHSRYSKVKNSAFVFLQPDFSFDNHAISKRNKHREQVKDNIRHAFQQAGSAYDITLVKQPLEALKYIKAKEISDPPVRWWKSHH